ncbi:YbaN family protein [Rhodobacter capsulatus]|uniref:YbaN family protein n=1 Tax=Rhodobacter capsulatus TaxID=1061 RepID=UPI004024FD1B
MTQRHTPSERLVRAVFASLGLLFCAVAFIGIFLPVLPTVPFLILAAGFFARSSERLEDWLLSHRAFGPMLRDWRARGAIPKRGKAMAVAGSALGLTLFVVLRHPPLWQAAAVLALMATGVGYVLTRPTA